MLLSVCLFKANVRALWLRQALAVAKVNVLAAYSIAACFACVCLRLCVCVSVL